MRLRGRAAAIRAYMASHRGDVPEIIQHARQALDYLPKQDSAWRRGAAVALRDAHLYKGDMIAAHQARFEAVKASKAAGKVYLILAANLRLAVILRHQGRLQRTIEICQQEMQLADESGISQTVVVGGLLAIWGEVLAEIDDLDGAINRARKGVELTEGGGDVAILSWSYLCLIRVLFTRGEMAGAEEIIQKMKIIAREYVVPPSMTSRMAGWRARIWLAQGKLGDASQWALERGLDADGDPTYLHEMEYIVLARILIAQGRLDKTPRLLPRLLEAAEAGGHTSRAIEILILQALTFQAGGDSTRAMVALERALTLAEPGGFIRIFVDEGPPMARLLYEALTRGIAADYARRLLAAFPMAEPEQISPPNAQAPESDLIEPLSERELEVLQLIAEGLTNPEIASRL
jgi:LuxR family maltose regulon positive regulatory protein